MKNQKRNKMIKYVENRQTGIAGSRLLSCIFLLGLGLSFFASCSGKKSEQPKTEPALPVAVEMVSRRSVPVQLHAIGNVEAYRTVEIKAQIGGTLSKVHFTEGQDINKGDLLFTIDPRPYEASLKQSEAALARDRAQYINAKKDAGRYAELVKKGYVSQEQYEQLRTNADALESVVQADLAHVENAKLQLSFCYIHAPVSGRAGSLLLHEGNLVKANADTPMVVINQIQPVNVTFTLPEKYLPEIRKYTTAGKLGVEALLAADDKNPAKGSLTFIENVVDASTGTIMMKATFSNQDRRLWPGQFVNVTITLEVQQDVTVVPTGTVQIGQQGQYVYVVKGDVAELRPVIAGTDYQGQTVIEKGLESGEQVVTDGQMRLKPGARVVIRKPQAPKDDAQRAESEEQGAKNTGQNQQTGVSAKDKAK